MGVKVMEIVVTECLRKALKLPDWVEIIEPAGLHSWHGWLFGSGHPSQFGKGIVWKALEHLEHCPKCRKASDLTKAEVKRELERFNRFFAP